MEFAPSEEFELIDVSRRKVKYPSAEEMQSRLSIGWRLAGVRIERRTGRVKAFFFRKLSENPETSP